jgi:hypothetical protein
MGSSRGNVRKKASAATALLSGSAVAVPRRVKKPSIRAPAVSWVSDAKHTPCHLLALLWLLWLAYAARAVTDRAFRYPQATDDERPPAAAR